MHHENKDFLAHFLYICVNILITLQNICFVEIKGWGRCGYSSNLTLTNRFVDLSMHSLKLPTEKKQSSHLKILDKAYCIIME